MKKKFQQQFDYDPQKRTLKKFIRRLYYSFKNRFLTEPSFFLNRNPAYSSWQIGDYTYGSHTGSPHIVHYGEPVKLTIGKFCSIADKVTIFLGGNHRSDWVTTYPFSVLFEEAGDIRGHPQSAGDIVIGNDVWIGQGAAILSGIKIGNGAIIAAHSLVTADVPAYGIVGGNPAKLIRKRFDDESIRQLEAIAWWNWDIRTILENSNLLLQPDITNFIMKHAKH